MNTDSTQPAIQAFHDPSTGTVSYVVWDRATRRAAIVDPVLDYDAAAARTSTRSAARLLACIEAEELAVDWILETHAHADHLSAARHLQSRVGGQVAIGARIQEVQARFADRGLHTPRGRAVLACWPLREERGDVVADASGHQRTGRIVNHGTWMIVGPAFEPNRVNEFSDDGYDPLTDPTRGHGLRLASDDLYASLDRLRDR